MSVFFDRAQDGLESAVQPKRLDDVVDTTPQGLLGVPPEQNLGVSIPIRDPGIQVGCDNARSDLIDYRRLDQDLILCRFPRRNVADRRPISGHLSLHAS